MSEAVIRTNEFEYARELKKKRLSGQAGSSGRIGPSGLARSESGRLRQLKNLNFRSLGAGMYLKGKEKDTDGNDGKERGKGLVYQGLGRILNRVGGLSGEKQKNDSSALSWAMDQAGKATKLGTAQIVRGLWLSMNGVFSIPLCILGLDIFAFLHLIFPKLISGVGEAWVPMPVKLKGGRSKATTSFMYELAGLSLLAFANALLFIVLYALITLIVFIVNSFAGKIIAGLLDLFS